VRLLLDTHAFLWWASGRQLGPLAQPLVEEAATEVLVSAATAWEIVTKVQLGRLRLGMAPDRWYPSRLRKHGFAELPILAIHALRVARLPDHHADPFDRLLVAQSQVEHLPLVTLDPAISRYDVDTVW
jgi:PIN domain nuclease of toxin-antitoxin system